MVTYSPHYITLTQNINLALLVIGVHKFKKNRLTAKETKLDLWVDFKHIVSTAAVAKVVFKANRVDHRLVQKGIIFYDGCRRFRGLVQLVSPTNKLKATCSSWLTPRLLFGWRFSRVSVIV